MCRHYNPIQMEEANSCSREPRKLGLHRLPSAEIRDLVAYLAELK